MTSLLWSFILLAIIHYTHTHTHRKRDLFFVAWIMNEFYCMNKTRMIRARFGQLNKRISCLIGGIFGSWKKVTVELQRFRWRKRANSADETDTAAVVIMTKGDECHLFDWIWLKTVRHCKCNYLSFFSFQCTWKLNLFAKLDIFVESSEC